MLIHEYVQTFKSSARIFVHYRKAVKGTSLMSTPEVGAVSHAEIKDLVSMQTRSFDPLAHLPEDLVVRIVKKLEPRNWYTYPRARLIRTFLSCLHS